MRGQKASVLVVVVAVLAAAGVLASSAGAVLVHVGHGQVAGIAPVRGVSPASIPGSFARRTGARPDLAGSGLLIYHGGPVMHGSSPYLIFWDPNNKISAADKLLYERYLADSAADSGKATNVFAVAQQFTDTTGFAQYRQVYASDHSITDTQPYPATSDQCTENRGFTETACLFDGQIQTEVKRVISANGLPTGVTGDAPIYFVVTPPDVNSCFDDNSTCADNFFCAYHSNFNDGGSQVLYSNMPTLLAANDPKSCQFDGNSSVQDPNGQPIADVVLKALSHEYNETITDPVDSTGWYATSTGQENGDECNFFGSPADPGNDVSPDAFKPYLDGGTAAAGNLFNQLVNANKYYVQSEWSNGGLNCRMQPTPSALNPAFSAPAVVSVGASVSFDPASSSSAGGFTSATWTFGDGGGSFGPGAPAAVSHTFAAVGTYTATLTLVDTFGNLSTVSHAITVAPPPSAAFGSAPAAPVAPTGVPKAQITKIKGHAVAGVGFRFDGSKSSDTGSTLVAYRWQFGDGGTAAGTSPKHTFKKTGKYSVSLTVTDASGQSSTSTGSIVVKPPSIGRVRVKKGKRVEQLKIALSGPGVLKFATKKFRVRRPRTVTIEVKLNGSQQGTLAQRHKLTVRYRLSFVPTSGKTGHKTVTIELKS